MERGWWSIEISGIKGEPSQTTLEHIASLIKQGYTQGEVIEENEEELSK